MVLTKTPVRKKFTLAKTWHFRHNTTIPKRKANYMMQAVKPTDRRVEAQYIMDGVVVMVCKPAKPRKGERTWLSGAKYTVANIGRKGQSLRNNGLATAKG